MNHTLKAAAIAGVGIWASGFVVPQLTAPLGLSGMAKTAAEVFAAGLVVVVTFKVLGKALGAATV